MTYRDHVWIDFFPDGKINRQESSIKTGVRIEKLYPGGQLRLKQTKEHRLEFYENEQLKVSYTWKNTAKKKNDDWTTCTIHKTEYDEKGQFL